MILFKKATDLHKWIETQRKDGNTIGFVPTMGALHEGHIALVKTSKQDTDITVCSIFVNPTQFNDPKDFEKYPITIEADIDMLMSAGCNVLFLPSVDEMYPDGLQSSRHYDLGYLETILEGKFRPGHFQGVCMIVDRLLTIVEPDRLFMGQKDYQQCMVIKRLLELTSRKLELIIHPTLRESDGLAMSSRNRRLNETERQEATKIYKELKGIKKNIADHDHLKLEQDATSALSQQGFRVDYVTIARAEDLRQPLGEKNEKLVALVAAYLGEVRLIDNMQLN